MELVGPYCVRIPQDILAFGIMASILAVLMFASVAVHSDIKQSPSPVNALPIAAEIH